MHLLALLSLKTDGFSTFLHIWLETNRMVTIGICQFVYPYDFEIVKFSPSILITINFKNTWLKINHICTYWSPPASFLPRLRILHLLAPLSVKKNLYLFWRPCDISVLKFQKDEFRSGYFGLKLAVLSLHNLRMTSLGLENESKIKRIKTLWILLRFSY